MRPREADLAITALVAVMTCAAAAVGAPVAVMTVLGVLLFAAPGYLLGQLLIGSDGSGLERVAAAARRRRPDVLARHVERLAARWLDCAEGYSALPFGGRQAPRDPAEASARLWLAAAAQAAIAAGLRLIGVTAPMRI